LREISQVAGVFLGVRGREEERERPLERERDGVKDRERKGRREGTTGLRGGG